MDKYSKLTDICKILSADARVQILQLLKQRPLCVLAISDKLDITQGAVSQHLRILRQAKLVVGEKKGYFVHYRLNEKTLNKWKGRLEKLLTV
jgi:ArsR family transcriptional regulator